MWPVAKLIGFEQALLGALGAGDRQGTGRYTRRAPQGACSQAKNLKSSTSGQK